MSDVIVKDSTIEGKGVFADRDFVEGEVVLKWDVSHVLSLEEFRQLPESEKRYVSYTDGEHILIQPPERYINHSCNANTTIKNRTDVAIRDIRKGEEITGDYTEDLGPSETLNCTCGSSNCKGIIRNKKN